MHGVKFNPLPPSPPSAILIERFLFCCISGLWLPSMNEFKTCIGPQRCVRERFASGALRMQVFRFGRC